MPVATRLCVSFPHTSLQALWADRELAAVVADRRRRVELRCDRMADWHPEALATACDKIAPARLVVTCRSPDQGGGAALDAPSRWQVLEEAVQRDVGWVDVELAAILAAPARWRTLLAARRCSRLLVSCHAKEMPSLAELVAMRRQVADLGGDAFKIAAPVVDAWQTLPLVRLLTDAAERGAPPVIPIATGAAGRFIRILAAKLSPDAPLCFAASDSGETPVAAGQLSWRSMVGRWRFDRMLPSTPVWAVLGMPVGHSWSPRVHNAILEAADRDGIYVRLPVAVNPAAFVAAFGDCLGLQGLSVTTPHKMAMVAACGRLVGAARRIGAVNTLSRDPRGQWVGSNTDGEAGRACLEGRLGRLRGQEIAILGTGGLARALAEVLTEAGARCLLVSRSPERGRALAAEVGCQSIAASELPARPQLRAIVNATPVGMRGGPPGMPLDDAPLSAETLVFESIYRPAQTPLMVAAQAQGCEVTGGAELFARQAALQAQAFYGLEVEPDFLRRLVDGAPGR